MKIAKILLGLLVILLILIVGVLVFAGMRPAEYKIERSAVINAPAEIIFSKVNNLKEWNSWSPWYEMEPTAEFTYTDPPEGLGAGYTWNGKELGSGEVKITKSEPSTLVEYDLNFTAPMESETDGWMKLEPEGDGIKATWGMSGENNLMGKVYDMFVNMDKMVGSDFEKGLGYLKKISEEEAAKMPPPVEEMPGDTIGESEPME
jgi:hypothetical protein